VVFGIADVPLLTLAVALVFGVGCGAVVRRMRLPAVTGQILIGIVLGPALLGWVDHEAVQSLRPITHFALGLIAVTVGSHLHFRQLRHAARRLGWLLLLEITLTPALVTSAVLWLHDGPWVLSILLAALAISTAPATVVALVRETRSKGVFVKTLVPAVALNNIAAICAFEFAHSIARLALREGGGSSGLRILLHPARDLIGAMLLGFVVGVALIGVTRRIVRSDQLATASFLAILVAVGLSEGLGLSSLLACLSLGMTLANLTPEKDELGHGVFENFAGAIYAVFFTLAGMELDVTHLDAAGALAVGVFLARGAGKVGASYLAMRWAQAPRRVRRYLGLALLPQAGVAVGLVLIAIEDPALAPVAPLLLAVGLATVTANEIAGPLLARLALGRSGDSGKDRARLIDFLHEENITVDLRPGSKHEVFAQLVDLLARSSEQRIDREALLANVLAREEEFSTSVGGGLAIPHGELEDGEQILGAMGICREGLDFDAPDGRPVHCVILLATPRTQRDRHLEVLGALSRILESDPTLRPQLFSARTPAHVHVLLHAEAADFNYFLED